MSEASGFGSRILDDAAEVLELARTRAATIATAESCTGGLIASALTAIPGSSDVFDRGLVTYSNAAKSDVLGVDPNLISSHGAVSEAVARAMAEGALAHSSATLSVAVTGVAGPDGGSAEKPVGLVHFAVASAGRPTRHEEQRFGDSGRSEIREATVERALELLKDALQAG